LKIISVFLLYIIYNIIIIIIIIIKIILEAAYAYRKQNGPEFDISDDSISNIEPWTGIIDNIIYIYIYKVLYDGNIILKIYF